MIIRWFSLLFFCSFIHLLFLYRLFLYTQIVLVSVLSPKLHPDVGRTPDLHPLRPAPPQHPSLLGGSQERPGPGGVHPFTSPECRRGVPGAGDCSGGSGAAWSLSPTFNPRRRCEAATYRSYLRPPRQWPPRGDPVLATILIPTMGPRGSSGPIHPSPVTPSAHLTSVPTAAVGEGDVPLCPPATPSRQPHRSPARFAFYYHAVTHTTAAGYLRRGTHAHGHGNKRIN